MGIRVEVVGPYGVSEAMKQLTKLTWLHDADPSGRRLKWYKKRYDYFLKPSERQHRRKQTVKRIRTSHGWTYPTLDGLHGWYVEDDLHW